MRYSMVIVSSNERLAQRLSCSSVIAIDSGESFRSAASCFCAHSPGCFLSLASISCSDSAEKQRSMSGIIAGSVGTPASPAKRAITASTLRLASGPERSAAPSAACRSPIVGTRHIGIDDAGPQRVRRLQAMAGQRQEGAQRTRQARQEIAAADIGEQADGGLRHGEQELLARHRMRAVHREADAAAHVDAVDQRDPRLGEAVDAAVDDVLVAEEVAPQRARRDRRASRDRGRPRRRRHRRRGRRRHAAPPP